MGAVEVSLLVRPRPSGAAWFEAPSWAFPLEPSWPVAPFPFSLATRVPHVLARGVAVQHESVLRVQVRPVDTGRLFTYTAGQERASARHAAAVGLPADVLLAQP